MRKLLYVVGSPRQHDSRSGKVADVFLNTLRQHQPDLEVDVLDLWREPLPEFDGDKAAAKMTVITRGTLEGATATAWDAITKVIDRFTSADDYLFTVPMWNGGIPYRLKLYVDTLTQPGFLFSFNPTAGYSGLLTGKRAVAIYTSGVYSPGVPSNFGVDYHSSYFGWWLRSVGITDITEIRYQPTLLTADPEKSLADAVEVAKRTAAQFAPALIS